jgi:hypothetical protein
MQTWLLRQLLFEHSCVVLQRRDFRRMCLCQTSDVSFMRGPQATKLCLESRDCMVLSCDSCFELFNALTARGSWSWCNGCAKLRLISICSLPVPAPRKADMRTAKIGRSDAMTDGRWTIFVS